MVVNILSLAGKGANKTEIMRRCSLKRASLEKYLFALTELNLLEVEEKSETFYRTSDKGLQLLRTYYRLKWLLWGDSFDFLLVRLLGRLSRRNEHKRSCGYIS
ncbi:MAG: winged helix-turn-helix domain-containing protein [Candidatus Bathyarchaeia archaeon]